METTSISTDSTGRREKRLIAFSSVLAAIFLTAMKLVVGLLTGSLGILAEAAHSGLDLIAAVVTFFSVRASDRPPDAEHLYGHGKIENLSALVETILLFITCGWIIYEAIRRLFFIPFTIEVTAWSFVIMVVSIIIDFSRSRALSRTAKKYSSQALEADALHFSTDVWSSSVVIVGLIGVKLGQYLTAQGINASWLFKADSVAALGVSAIVIYISWQLGGRTVGMLLDRAPKGTAKQIEEQVAKLPGVSSIQHIRVRQSGPTIFADIVLAVPRSTNFEEAHEIAEQTEVAVRKLIPRCDVMVHVEPVVGNDESMLERVRSVAARQGISVHDLHLQDVQGRLSLEIHAEVPDNISVYEAHERVTTLEKALTSESPEFGDVVVHIEPAGDKEERHHVVPIGPSYVHEAINKSAQQIPGIKNCHSISILRNASQVTLSFHCAMVPDYPITRAHELVTQMENLLRERLPTLGRITIHIEPYDDKNPVL